MSRLQSAAGPVPQRWSFGQWPLRRKLAAAVVLPVLLAFVFGGLRVKNDFDSSRQLSQAADTVLVIRPVVEYNLAVQRLAAAESIGGGGVIAAITKYESAAANLRIAVKRAGVPDSVKANAETALSLGQAVRSAKTQSGFSDVVIDKSGNTASLMSTAVSDLGLSDDSASAKIVVALQDSIAAQRAMTGEQLNLANTDDAAAKLRAIGQVGAETAALTRLQSAASPGQSGQIRQLLNENGRRGYTLQQDAPDRAQIEGLGTGIESSNAGYSQLMAAQLTALESNLRERAADHRSEAILNAVIVLGALALALALVVALMRSLLIPIRAVRQGALEVANTRLPEAVAAMRDGEELPAFEAIPVHTTEEMGQLARAVDDLHTQARTLAGEQARLRVQVGHMFETLSRRSTSLIDQQLSLIERLESDEEDPKRLQSLFRLDHLAARMRRNSDSLLVLAGTSTRRGVSGSLSVSDAVRAAVSEVENYERIDIGDTSNDHVLGAVGSDLIHLVAEIVDNALSYSPPTSRVAIRGARTPEGGLLIEVADRGLGMPPNDLAAINDQLAHGGDITADTARRMGLFVVGSLAKRHGIAVRLRRNGDDKQGITVSVHLPAGLLADSSRGDRPIRPATAVASSATEVSAAPTVPPTSAVGGTTKAGLPTRVRGASGATGSPVPGAAKKVLPTRTPGAHGPTAGGGLPAIVKPVIEGADAPVEQKAPTNGKAAEDHGPNGSSAAPAETYLNGEAATVERSALAEDAVTGSTVGAEPGAEAVADATKIEVGTADEAPLFDDDAKVDAAQVDDAQADAAQVEAAQTGGHPLPDTAMAETLTADIAGADTPETGSADEPQRSAAGLPVRKPRATGITEYREFQDAPSTAQDTDPAASGSRSDAPAAKAGRLSWLPGRKAAAEAARAEVEADDSRQMPTNLSAWLDHRAKLVEAAKARELGTDAPASAQDDSAGWSGEAVADGTPDSTTDVDLHDVHVPEEWVAEAANEAANTEAANTEAANAEAVDRDADTTDRDADTTDRDADSTDLDATLAGEQVASAASEYAVAEVAAPPVPDIAEMVAEVPAPVDSLDLVEAPAPDATAPLPTRVPGATSAVAEQAPADEVRAARPALRAHSTSFFGARRARGAAADAPQQEHPELTELTESVTDDVPEGPTHLVAVEGTRGVTDEVTQGVTDEVPEAPTHLVTDQLTEGVADEAAVELTAGTTPTAADLQVDLDREIDPADVDAEPDETPRGDLNDTPIFRAMMSRWLTDDSGAAQASTSWSTSEADQAWSAAARIEETQPLEESAAGLPQRRPGSYLIPGAIDEPDEKPAAAAAARRDPEAIRRNLNRHMNGVSSARTEAQDGTHREEADVHH